LLVHDRRRSEALHAVGDVDRSTDLTRNVDACDLTVLEACD
jgi:hypothetical protein